MCYKRKDREFMASLASRSDAIEQRNKAAADYLKAVADAFDRIYLLDRLNQISLTACSLTQDPVRVNDKRRKDPRYQP